MGDKGNKWLFYISLKVINAAKIKIDLITDKHWARIMGTHLIQ